VGKTVKRFSKHIFDDDKQETRGKKASKTHSHINKRYHDNETAYDDESDDFDYEDIARYVK
jgi:hypothetical protein